MLVSDGCNLVGIFGATFKHSMNTAKLTSYKHHIGVF